MTVSCRSRVVNKFSHYIKQDRHLAGACKVMPSMTIWWPKGLVCNKDSESFQVCPALHIVCRCRVEVTLENPFQKVWITSNHSMFRFQPNDTARTLYPLLYKGFDAIWRCTKVALLALINAFKNFIYHAQPNHPVLADGTNCGQDARSVLPECVSWTISEYFDWYLVNNPFHVKCHKHHSCGPIWVQPVISLLHHNLSIPTNLLQSVYQILVRFPVVLALFIDVYPRSTPWFTSDKKSPG